MTQPSTDGRKLYGVMQLSPDTSPNFRGAWRNLGQAHWERDNANQHARYKDAPPFEVYEMTRITEEQP